MSSEINIIGTKYFVPRVRGLFQASDLAYFLFLSQLINSSLAKIDYKDCFKVGLRRLMIKIRCLLDYIISHDGNLIRNCQYPEVDQECP